MVAAANKLTADARQKARAYNIALGSMPEPLPISTIDVLRGIGLDKHIGLEVAGYACFTTHPSNWQAIVLADVLYGKGLGKKLPTAISATKHLASKGLVRPEFRWVSNDLEEAIEALDNRFAAPWRAVEFYLKYLTGVGVALDWTHGFAISPTVASSWFDQVMEEMSRSSARTGIEETVRWLLDQLPGEERGGMTVEDWLNMTNPETTEPYAALLASTRTMQPVEAELRAIVGLFNGTRTDVRELLGLPIANECDRRLAVVATKEAEKKARAAVQAEIIKINRQKELAGYAETVLNDPGAWLNEPHPDLDGRSPLEAAYHGYHAAGKAREILSAIERRQRADRDSLAEATLWRQKLRKAVEQQLSKDEAEAFLSDRDEDYNRSTAIIFCRDEASFRLVLRKLEIWINAFGSKRHHPF